MERAGGQVEGVAMPMKDGEAGGEQRGEPIGGGVLGAGCSGNQPISAPLLPG